MKFIKKHSIVSTFLAVILLVTFYYAVVVINAYIETPEKISKVMASDRMVLKLEDFSDEYMKILLSVEDPAFYSHNGIDLSTPGAGMTTITQGLVKRYYFDNFKPGVIAKLKQSLIALILNRRVDKKTQLQLFVNSVYMGTIDGQDVIGLSDAA